MFMKNYCVTKEYHNVELKVVEGKLPPSMSGTYYKNGPAWRAPIKHMLDGDGYVTAVRFNNGKAYLSGKYISHTEANKGPNAFEGPMLTLKALNNKSNTNIIPWNDKLIAFYEGGVPVVVDPVTLQTEGLFGDYKEGVPFRIFGGQAVNAHPKEKDGRLIVLDLQYSLGFGKLGTWLRFREYDNANNANFVDLEHEVHIPSFLYLHDFAVTTHFYVFVKHPLSVSFKNMKKGVASSLVQDAKESSVVYAVNRITGKLHKQWEIHEELFITHIISCSDDPWKVVLGAVSYKNYGSIEKFQRVDEMRNRRISISCYFADDRALVNGRSPEYLVEFPNGKYGTFGKSLHPVEGIIRLVDSKVCFHGSEDMIVGEPVEVDGRYVVFFVHQHDGAFSAPLATWVYIMHRDTIICKVEMPDTYVPFGLHGFFKSDKT